MTIKSSGSIAVSDINIELAFNANTPKSLNDSDVRTLLAKSSGVISLSDAYGKTKVVTGVDPVGNAFATGQMMSGRYVGYSRLNSNTVLGLTSVDYATFQHSSPNPDYIPVGAGRVYELIEDTVIGGEASMAGIFPGAPFYVTIYIDGLDLIFEYVGTDGTYSFYNLPYDRIYFNIGQVYNVN